MKMIEDKNTKIDLKKTLSNESLFCTIELLVSRLFLDGCF